MQMKNTWPWPWELQQKKKPLKSRDSIKRGYHTHKKKQVKKHTKARNAFTEYIAEQGLPRTTCIHGTEGPLDYYVAATQSCCQLFTCVLWTAKTHTPLIKAWWPARHSGHPSTHSFTLQCSCTITGCDTRQKIIRCRQCCSPDVGSRRHVQDHAEALCSTFKKSSLTEP